MKSEENEKIDLLHVYARAYLKFCQAEPEDATEHAKTMQACKTRLGMLEATYQSKAPIKAQLGRCKAEHERLKLRHEVLEAELASLKRIQLANEQRRKKLARTHGWQPISSLKEHIPSGEQHSRWLMCLFFPTREPVLARLEYMDDDTSGRKVWRMQNYRYSKQPPEYWKELPELPDGVEDWHWRPSGQF